MPPTKAYRGTSSQLRPVSRNSSATKLGTNLQFTQKDVPYTNKKNTQTRVQRTSSSQRLVPKDLQPVQRPPANKQPKPKAGFTLSNDDEDDDDDDEWVSSESGAATPNLSHSSDSEDAPPRSVTPPASSTPLQKQKTLPKVSAPPLARVETARPSDFQAPTPPPPPLTKRKSHSRPSSMHIQTEAVHQPPLRPHPLIRGHSFGLGGPKALTPLTTTTTTPNVAPAELSASPPVRDAGSPATITTISVSPPSTDTRSNRRTSISSARSVATLPVLPSTNTMAREKDSSRDVKDYRQPPQQQSRRNRTLSTLSTLSASSSSAAISSLVNALPGSGSNGHGHHPHHNHHFSIGFGFGPTRPSSPGPGASGHGHGHANANAGGHPDLVCFFPKSTSSSSTLYSNDESPQNETSIQLQSHPLLPPPYLSNHLTVLAHRTPVREAYDRVMRAKMGMGGHGHGHAITTTTSGGGGGVYGSLGTGVTTVGGR